MVADSTPDANTADAADATTEEQNGEAVEGAEAAATEEGAETQAEPEAEAEVSAEDAEAAAALAAEAAAAAAEELSKTVVTCDLHYELDWNYYLRFESTCGEIAAKDPCFATFACVCSNGYFRIADKMPARPADLDNGSDLADILKEADEEKQTAVETKEVKAQEEAKANVVEPETITEESFFDTLETWHYIVAGCGLLVLLVLIGLCCFCCCKKPRVKPMPIDDSMGPIDYSSNNLDSKDKHIEVGAMGALTQKKRKGKKKKTTAAHNKDGADLEVTAPNMHGGPTDDEASNLQIANPDSFLGNHSAQNFNKSPINRNGALSPASYSSRSKPNQRVSSNNPMQMQETREPAPDTQQASDTLGLPQITPPPNA